MSSLIPREQLNEVEMEARERVEAAEAARRTLQQELLSRTAEAVALDEENATLRKVAVSASRGSINVSRSYSLPPCWPHAAMPTTLFRPIFQSCSARHMC